MVFSAQLDDGGGYSPTHFPYVPLHSSCFVPSPPSLARLAKYSNLFSTKSPFFPLVQPSAASSPLLVKGGGGTEYIFYCKD
jgi:hypothetical protein